MREIRDSEIAREILDPAEDAHAAPQSEPDEDSSGAYFAGRLHQDWNRQPHPWRYFAGWFLASMAGTTVLIFVIAWLVTG